MAKSKKGTTDIVSIGRSLRPAKKGRHGLYIDLMHLKIDGRRPLPRKRKQLRRSFLEGFKTPPSARIIALADGAAINWILCEGLRAMVMRGDPLPPSVLKDYAAIYNVLARDLMTLEALAKEGDPGDKAPSLAEYLAEIKSGKLIPVKSEVEAEPEHVCKCGAGGCEGKGER